MHDNLYEHLMEHGSKPLLVAKKRAMPAIPAAMLALVMAFVIVPLPEEDDPDLPPLVPPQPE